MSLFKQILVLVLVLSMLVSCNILSIQEIITTTSTQSRGTSTTTTTIPTTTPNIDFDPDEDNGPTSDPYVNMTEEEFYANYTPATSYSDAVYRSKHYFMSGSIEEQDQAPTIAKNQPMEDGKFIRNTSALYSTDGNTYYIIDSEGNIVNRVFKGGAYVTLEEVAAYVFAFGDVPANYTSSKKTKPTSSPWGEYLRLNNTYFSGDTDEYPYEPVLPNISGCGGELKYYEIDIGTTGTDCDPAYDSVLYNNGYKISRGAARIVYTRYDKNGNKIIDIDEMYVFYTYNHYNDFQEYLNYEGGWGEMFGNITGGGTISSRYDYNPTDYVSVVRKNLYKGAIETSNLEFIEVAFIYIDKKYYYDSTFSA